MRGSRVSGAQGSGSQPKDSRVSGSQAVDSKEGETEYGSVSADSQLYDGRVSATKGSGTLASGSKGIPSSFSLSEAYPTQPTTLFGVFQSSFYSIFTRINENYNNQQIVIKLQSGIRM